MKKLILFIFVSVLILQSVSAFDWTNGTVARYGFDEGSGNKIVDSAYSLHNATGNASATYVRGKIGTYAGMFNGRSTAYNTSDANDLDLTGNFSMQAWIYWNGTGNGGGAIVAKNPSSGGSNYLFQVNQSDGVEFRWFGNTNWQIVGSRPITRNRWYYVVGTWNGTTQAIFLDGVLNATSIPAELPLANIGNLSIGRSNDLGYDSIFNGTLDDIAIWNRSLSNSEILELYNFGVNLVTLNLPANNTIVSSLIFNTTISPQFGSATNATLYLWNASNSLVNKTVNLISGNVQNQTIFNLTSQGLPIGNYIWNVYGCEANSSTTNCTFQQSNFSFAYGVTINSQTFNPTAIKTSLQSYVLNITLSSGSTLSGATFYYNNTAYSPSITLEGNNRIISSSFNVPANPGTINYPLFWKLDLIDSSGSFQYNTSATTQTVNDISIDNCTVNSILILNFSMRDEDTRVFFNTSATNLTTNYYVTLSGDPNAQTYIYFSNSTATNPVRICVSSGLVPSTNYRLDMQMDYQETNSHVLRHYYIDNQTVTTASFPLQYGLYDLLTTRAQAFQISYSDANGVPVPNAIIEIDRQYLEIGQFLPVEIAKTSTDGTTSAYFVTDEIVYNILVKKNGQLLATFNNVRAQCSNTGSGICTFKLNGALSGTSFTDFQNYLNVTYNNTYNSTTRVYSLYFSSTDSVSKFMNLTGVLQNSNQTTTICSTSATATSGVLTCTIPSSVGNGTAIFQGYVNGEPLFTDYIQLGGGLSGILSPVRYLFAFLMVLTLPLMGMIGSPVFAVILFIVGLISAGVFGFVDYGGFIGAGSAFMWILIASIILIIKLNRDEGI